MNDIDRALYVIIFVTYISIDSDFGKVTKYIIWCHERLKLKLYVTSNVEIITATKTIFSFQ